MNLYLFNANDIAARYGIGTYLKELILALKSPDIRITVVHLHTTYQEFEIVKTNQVENWYIPEVYNHNTLEGSVQLMEDYYKNVIYLLRLNIKDTTDLVFHFNYNKSHLLAKELKTIYNCITVTTVHYIKWALELNGNLLHLQAIRKKPENLRSLFEQLLDATDEYESLLYKEVDRVITLSQYTRTLFCCEYQLNPEKVVVIPNGLEEISPLTEAGRNVLRKKWHLSEKERLILFVGRLNSVKGLLFLIQAFRKVLNTNSDCRLMVSGEGNYNIYFQEAKNICTKITFTGLLEKRDLYELYSLADIGVMPSFHEQCSYVAIEMMMHGVPLIASTSTGLKEMIVDRETGLHIPVIEYGDRVEIDTSSLAEKILYLLQNHDERKHMGENARKRYESMYTAEQMRRQMITLYRTMQENTN